MIIEQGHGCTPQNYKDLGRWFEEKDIGVFEQWYLHNLVPEALAAQGGYDGRNKQSYVIARSRAWWSPSKLTDTPGFTVAGMVLSDKLKKLIEFMFPGILQQAESCWRAWRDRNTSSQEHQVVSQTNLMATEALVYLTVVWLQDCGKREKEHPSIVDEIPYCWKKSANTEIKSLFKELADDVEILESDALVQVNQECSSFVELQSTILDKLVEVRM